MAVKVAINGFSGRSSSFQTNVWCRGYEIVAINDLTNKNACSFAKI